MKLLSQQDIAAMNRAVEAGLFDVHGGSLSLWRLGNQWRISASAGARCIRDNENFSGVELHEVVDVAIEAIAKRKPL